jgi:hypothetical protein
VTGTTQRLRNGSLACSPFFRRFMVSKYAADQPLVTSWAQSDMSSPKGPWPFWSGHIPTTELALGSPSLMRAWKRSMHHAQASPPETSRSCARDFLAGVAITFTRKVRTTQPLGTEPLPKLTAMKIGRGWGP